MLVAASQAFEFLQRVLQRILVVGAARTMQVQGSTRHLLVVAHEKLAIDLVLGRQVIELDVADPHALFAGHLNQAQNDRRRPLGVDAGHGGTDVPQNGELAAAVITLAQQHAGQLGRDVLVPDGAFDGVRVKQVVERGHAAPLARLAPAVRHLFGEVPFNPPLQDLEQQLDIVDRLVVQVQLGIFAVIVSVWAERLLHHVGKFEFLLAVIRIRFLRRVIGTRLPLRALLGLRLAQLFDSVVVFFGLNFFFSQKLIDDLFDAVVQFLRDTESREVLEHVQVLGHTALPALQHRLGLENLHRLDQEGTIRQQRVVIVAAVVVQEHVEKFQQQILDCRRKVYPGKRLGGAVQHRPRDSRRRLGSKVAVRIAVDHRRGRLPHVALQQAKGAHLDGEAVQVGRVQRLVVIILFGGIAGGYGGQQGDTVVAEFALVEDPQQHVQGLAGGAGNIVEYTNFGGQDAAFAVYLSDHLAARLVLLSENHGIADQFRQARVPV